MKPINKESIKGQVREIFQSILRSKDYFLKLKINNIRTCEQEYKKMS